MTHFYERNIVEIKTEYLNYLSDVLVPLIYEGIQSVYKHAQEQSKKFDELAQNNPNIQNPNVIKIFQGFLKGIPTLSSVAIANETKRIKESSRCSEWFDDLVKAVMKSYIILLTYNSSGKTCKLVNEKYHEKINIDEFIHKCYIECASIFYNNPELFWHEHPKETLQLCKTNAYNYIKQAIFDAVHKVLPIRAILQEYLSNDYIVEPKQHNEIQPENGFALLESEKKKPEKFNVDGVNLIETSKESEHAVEQEKEIKEKLEHIIADEQIKEQQSQQTIPNQPIENPIIKPISPEPLEIKPMETKPLEIKPEIPQPIVGGDAISETKIDKYFAEYINDVKQ